jgi:ribosomal protein S18 acetylase RimI-like enzyme
MERALDPHRLEEALLNATAPPEQLLYDGWLIRLSREHIKRASSVNAIFPSRLDLEDKVEHCEAAYRSRSLIPTFRITSLEGSAATDRLLESRGYSVFEPSLVMAADLAGMPAVNAPAGLTWETADIEPWVAMVGRMRAWSDADIAAHTRRMTSSVLPSYCLSLIAGGEVASCGVVTIDGEYAGLFDIYTPPQFRGKGLATALCARLLEIGRAQGATIGWLSVLGANGPALAVYRRLGFTTAYEYWYRVPPDHPRP